MSELEMPSSIDEGLKYKTEKNQEYIPTAEEVLSLFKELVGKNEFVEIKKLEDEQGLYLWEIEITREDGGITRYSYIRKGNYREKGLPGGSASVTAIHVAHFNNEGLPISGRSVCKLIEGEWKKISYIGNN